MKALISDIHLGFWRKKCEFDYSDSLLFSTLPRARGSNAGTLIINSFKVSSVNQHVESSDLNLKKGVVLICCTSATISVHRLSSCHGTCKFR